MKKYLILFVAALMIFAVSVNAAPIAVGGEKEDGAMLSTAPESVASARELVVAAARLHSLYNNGTLSEASSMEACYDYAVQNDIITPNLFESMDVEIDRAIVAYVLERAIPEDKLSPINAAILMPDSDPSSDYYAPALKLMNAGIMEGMDKYGSFGPSYKVRRYELSDIVSRITEDSARIEKDYVEYASDEPFYLIDDYLMGDTTSVRNVYNIGSGWKYDYSGSTIKPKVVVEGGVEDVRNTYANTLRDLSTTDNITITRDIFPQNDGLLVLETSFHITVGFDGFILKLNDKNGDPLFEMGTESVSRYSNYLYFMNNGVKSLRYLSYVSSGTYAYDPKYNLYADRNRTNDSRDQNYRLSDQIRMRLEIDLDKDTVKVSVGGTNYGTYNLKSGYDGFSQVEFTTGISETIEYTVKQVHLYKNYVVNDKFRVDRVGSTPAGYSASGSLSVSEMLAICDNQGDFYSAKLTAPNGYQNAYAKRTFRDTSGKVQLEAYILPDGKDGVYFSVGSGGTDVLKIVTNNKKFYIEKADGTLGQELRFFTPNVWQGIRIEADTAAQTALIKINGKVVAQDVPFNVKANNFDQIMIGATGKNGQTIVWFDDVEVHEMFEQEDYVPEPVPLDTGNYILSMSVCNLWRNGSHYGWEYIEPHEEIEPITGFYDEGNPEAMDWEIKFLAEHGISTYAMCWYAPQSPASVPIRKPRMIDAHHEGYFNAKYTEYLDFSIMWENASFGTPGTVESFKENIFPFWMDWYFSDERYFRLEEDGKEYLFLTIYKYDCFRNMCLPAKSGAYASNVADKYNADELRAAEQTAKELLDWMKQQVIDAGYADGIQINFTNNAGYAGPNESMINMAGTSMSVFPYAWGNSAYSLDVQKALIETNYKFGQQYGVDLLAMAAVGFNDIGWAYKRYPLINDEDFLELLKWMRDDYMPRYADDEDSWKQYFVQFDTWNEYGEGHYIYPTVGLEKIEGTTYGGYGGYGYLEAIAKTFGTNYDQELHEQIDIIPTEEQKARIGRLFVPGESFIRREYLPNTMKETPIPAHKIMDMRFTNATSEKLISNASNFLAAFKYDKAENAVKAVSSGVDPIINFDQNSMVNGISADDVGMIHLRMKTSLSNSKAQIFYRVDTMPKKLDSAGNYTTYYSEDYEFTFDLGPAGEWVDYYIDTGVDAGFTGTIETIRLDPGNLSANTVYISQIEFLKFSEEQRRLDISIDSVRYHTADYWEEQETSYSEIYLAPEDSNNFYKFTHIVYHWNEKAGNLILDTPNGTTLEFNIGSDKVLINGNVTETLRKPMTLYDGVPVLPILYVFDKADINYIYDYANKKLDITVSDVVKFEDIYNPGAEHEDNGSFYSDKNPRPEIRVDSDDTFNHVWYVPGASNVDSYFGTDVVFEAGKTYRICLDAKLDSLAGAPFMGSEYDLFYKAVYDDGSGSAVSKTGKIATIQWNGKWAHVEADFTIPATRVYNPRVKESIGVYIAHDFGYGVNYYIDNINVKSDPIPFKLINGDGESGDNSDGAWWSANANIEIVDDGMGTGNHVISVSPAESSSKWVYLRQNTKFETGTTYYYSFDFKMGPTEAGEVVKTTFAINPRYDDLLQNHFTQNPDDHPTTFNTPTISADDGWKHYSGSFTISAGYQPNINDEITFFVNPVTINGVQYGFTYQVDNFKVSTKPIS